MENYYREMTARANDGTVINPDWDGCCTTGAGYTCPYCGQWVTPGFVHHCPTRIYGFRSDGPNPTEQAYRILKALVDGKAISEPDSYKKFCELIEAIKKALCG